MIQQPSQPCPLCRGPAKLHKTQDGWVCSCVGDKHCVAIYGLAGPDETVAEWDRKCRERPSPVPPGDGEGWAEFEAERR